MKTVIKIKGMHCESCKFVIEDICGDIPGVVSCDANVEGGTLTIEHEQPLDYATLTKEIEDLKEYTVEEVSAV